MFSLVCGIFPLFAVTSQSAVVVNSSDFRTVLTSSAFVDKTMFIKHVLESEGNFIITAPPKFGKSTNINMVKTFLEIEVDEFGKPRTNKNITTDLINDTENYLLFEKYKLRITKYQYMMEKHFGKTPVIRVDFKQKVGQGEVTCMYDVVKLCKLAVHCSFKEHDYLIHSEKLTDVERQSVTMWCDDHSYKTKVDNMFISYGIQMLCVYLYRHFGGKKVFIVMDNHDYLMAIVTQSVKDEEELRHIVNFLYGIISDAIIKNDEVLYGSVITGILGIPNTSSRNFSTCQTCLFLENHEFVEFYGFTKQEVDALSNKSEFQISPNEIQILHKYYYGYHSKGGSHIYNLFSVLMFLKIGKVGKYFTAIDFPFQISDIFQAIPNLRQELNRLMQGKTIHVQKISPVNYTGIWDVLRAPSIQQYNSNYLILFLMHWGLLTFDCQVIAERRGFEAVKIPNSEIKAFFLENSNYSKEEHTQ